MKKNLLFTSLAVLTSLLCTAQPIIDYSNAGLHLSDVHNVQFSNLTAPTSTGANASWNYANVTAIGALTFTVVPPGSTPVDSFPLANVALDFGNGNYTYYKSGVGGNEVHGQYINNVMFKYSDPEVIQQYPYSFGNSHNDSWECEYSNGTVTITRTGTTAVIADGYGTLILPNGGFNNVLRVKTNQVYQDKIGGTPFQQYLSETINWIKPGVRYPLAYYNEQKIDTNTIRSSVYQDQLVGGPTAIGEIVKLESIIKHYPNPASDFINIDLVRTGNFSIELTDLNGRVVLKKSIVSNDQINVSDLANGNYLLHISEGGQRMAGELISINH